MDAPLISVIVPIYKAEEFLPRCVDSILAQTYAPFELILVDDGSPDGCGAICDAYAAKDARVRVIHKANEGVSVARNVAVDAANGAYISFVDADDSVLPGMLSYLYDALSSTDATIAVCGMAEVAPDEPTPAALSPGRIVTLTAEQALSTMLYQKLFFTSPWAKLLPAEIVRAHPFPERQRYEDMATTYLWLSDAVTVALDTAPFYRYVQHPVSFMRQAFSPERFALLDTSETVYRFIEAHYPAVLPAARARRFAAYAQVLLQTPRDDAYRAQRDRMRTCMQADAPLVLRDRNCRAKDRVAAIVFRLFGESGLRLLWRAAAKGNV